MTAAPVIEAVRRAGGRILVRGGHLRLSAPAPLPDTLIAQVRQHKAEILDVLRTAAPAISAEATAWRFTCVHCASQRRALASRC